MQFWPIEVQRALNRHAGFNLMQWLGLQARLTLTFTWTLRNWVVPTRAFITIWSWSNLGIGRWRKLDIVCVWFVTKFGRELASHRLSRWAESGIQILYIFELSWWKSVHIIYFKIQVFGGPNTQLSQNVVKSAVEVFWIEACLRKCGIPVSWSCPSSVELQRRLCLLRFTLSSCSSIMELELQHLL